MENASTERKPEILVFAGPNGSGKTTITRLTTRIGTYVNADEIKAALNCTDLEAAQHAEKQREYLLSKCANFSFETVLSTDRNLLFLKRAKDVGYFIRCIYVLTDNPSVISIECVFAHSAVGMMSPKKRLFIDTIEHYNAFPN